MRKSFGFTVSIIIAFVMFSLTGCRHSDEISTNNLPSGKPESPPVSIEGRGAAVTTTKAAPDFTLETLDGQKYTLLQLKGKPVLINFWASWCPACVHEAPDLDAVYKAHKERGLVLLGVAVSDNKTALEKMVAKLKLTYPIGINDKAGVAYNVTAIPTTFLIDRKGNIASSFVGARPKAEIETELKKIL